MRERVARPCSTRLTTAWLDEERQAEVLAAEEVVVDARVGGVADSPCPVRFGEQPRDGGCELDQIGRVGGQHARSSVRELVADSADAARDDGARLAHRLGDGEAEALGQALSG